VPTAEGIVMGFVSYMEDIQQAKDSLQAEIRSVALDREKAASDAHRALARAQALVRAAERLVGTIDSNMSYYLSLATDPSVELVDMVDELQQTKRKLEQDVKQRSCTVIELRTREAQLTQQIRTLKIERDTAKKDARRRDRDFERLAALNPSAAYELYSSPDHIARLKPDA
jgi:chromosome segregation ATPase